MTIEFRWVEHQPGFLSLMLGRIELAQIYRGAEHFGFWYWTLMFSQNDERKSFSAPTEQEARAVAEEHARKVITNG